MELQKLQTQNENLVKAKLLLNDTNISWVVSQIIDKEITTIKERIEELNKPPLSEDEKNLIKYRKLEKDFNKARNEDYAYFRKCAGDWGGMDKLTPEQKEIKRQMEEITDDFRKEIKRMEENELNKPKTVKIGNKSYIVANSYGSNRGWGQPDRCIIVGETDKMYKIQFVPSKFDGWDSQQTSHYHYEYPTELKDKFTNKGKKTVKQIMIYEKDTYETLCD